jgi:hypothetical protein
MTDLNMTMKASELTKALQLMSARLSRGKIQFNPLKITMSNEDKGKEIIMASMMGNFNGTASVTAKYTGPEGKIKKPISFCVDADVMLDYLEECYGADEMIDVTIKEGEIVLVNTQSQFPTQCKFYTEDESTVRALAEFPVVLKDGMAYYKQGTIKPETEIVIDAAELQKVIKKRDHVKRNAREGTGPNYHRFDFSADGSVAIIGDPDDKTISPIRMAMNCKVTGSDSSVILGTKEFEQITGIQTGEIHMFAKTDCPIWIIVKGDSHNVGYLIAPKAKEAEVNTEVTGDGDVQIMEPEDDDVPEPEISVIEDDE